MARRTKTPPAAISTCTYDSPVGELTLAATNEGLKGLWLAGQKYFGGSMADQIDETASAGSSESQPNSANDAHVNPEEQDGARAHLTAACSWLDRYFANQRPIPSELTLAPEGSDFRQIIWKLLCEIPYGAVRTYGELAHDAAKLMGKERMSAQATGGAVGHNPISIIIPCHRAVGADGSLTGYAGGIDRKLALLKHEEVDCSGFYVPAHSTAP